MVWVTYPLSIQMETGIHVAITVSYVIYFKILNYVIIHEIVSLLNV